MTEQLPGMMSCLPNARKCRPLIYAGPSGKRLRHAWDCPVAPGQPITVKEYVGRGRKNPTPWRGQ